MREGPRGAPGALGQGPGHEPSSLVCEWLGWNLTGVWRDPRGGDYLAALSGVTVPVLAVAGEGDRLLAPPARNPRSGTHRNGDA